MRFKEGESDFDDPTKLTFKNWSIILMGFLSVLMKMYWNRFLNLICWKFGIIHFWFQKYSPHSFNFLHTVFGPSNQIEPMAHGSCACEVTLYWRFLSTFLGFVHKLLRTKMGIFEYRPLTFVTTFIGFFLCRNMLCLKILNPLCVL